MENGMNNPTAAWTYKPQLCVLKPQPPIQAFVNTDSVLGYGVKPIGFRKYKLSVDGSKFDGDVSLGSEVNGTLGEYTAEYYSYVKHIGSAAHGFAEFGGCFQPLSLHVGVLPVHSYSSIPTDDDIPDITVIYKIDTMIDIEYSYDIVLPYSARGNAHTLYTGDNSYIRQSSNIVNAYGYKTKLADIPVTTHALQSSSLAITMKSHLPSHTRVTRSTTTTTTELPLPLLVRYRHQMKPKLTQSPSDENYNSFNKQITSVCDTSNFPIPLSRVNFHIMSDKYKYTFVRFNYPLFEQSSVERCAMDYTLFSYLYNNCSINDKRRESIGNVVIHQLKD